MTIKKTAVLLLLLSLSVGLASAQSAEDRIAVLSPRAAALGGLHAARADDLGSLFDNPAGFQSVAPVLRVSETAIGLSGPIFDISGLVVEAIGGTDISTLLLEPDVQALLNGLAAGMKLMGPISLGYVGGGLGAGIFSWTDASFKSVGTLTLEASVQETVLINGGYAFRIPFPAAWNTHVDIGLLLKAFLQAEVRTVKSVLDLVSLMADPAALLLGQPFALNVGVGADVGIRWSLGEWFALGIVARDAYSPTRMNEYASLTDFLGTGTATPVTGTIPLDLSAGLLLSPKLGRFGRFVSGLELAVDYNDILDYWLRPGEAKNWILHLGVGLEATLLKILAVRVGFTQGLFAAGIGLDLKFMQLDAAMYGTELSSEPGLRPVYNIALGMSFDLTPGDRKPREPRERKPREKRRPRDVEESAESEEPPPEDNTGAEGESAVDEPAN